MNAFKFTLLPCAIFLTAQSTFGGQGSISGREPWLWRDEHSGVVIAVIRDIQKSNEADGRYTALLLLKSSLAGHIDPSATPALHVIFYPDQYGSSIKAAPRNEATILAVINLGRKDAGDNADKDSICGDRVIFMPDHSGMVVLKGADDPRVEETLQRIQEARAHPDPDVNTSKSTTKPIVRGERLKGKN